MKNLYSYIAFLTIVCSCSEKQKTIYVEKTYPKYFENTYDSTFVDGFNGYKFENSNIPLYSENKTLVSLLCEGIISKKIISYSTLSNLNAQKPLSEASINKVKNQISDLFIDNAIEFSCIEKIDYTKNKIINRKKIALKLYLKASANPMGYNMPLFLIDFAVVSAYIDSTIQFHNPIDNSEKIITLDAAMAYANANSILVISDLKPDSVILDLPNDTLLFQQNNNKFGGEFLAELETAFNPSSLKYKKSTNTSFKFTVENTFQADTTILYYNKKNMISYLLDAIEANKIKCYNPYTQVQIKSDTLEEFVDKIVKNNFDKNCIKAGVLTYSSVVLQSELLISTKSRTSKQQKITIQFNANCNPRGYYISFMTVDYADFMNYLTEIKQYDFRKNLETFFANQANTNNYSITGVKDIFGIDILYDFYKSRRDITQKYFNKANSNHY